VENYRTFFPQQLDDPILDIGVGTGDLLLLWQRLGYRNVWGIDINAEPVEVCRKAFPKYRISQTPSTAAFLRTHPQTFSLITMFDVLEHLPKEEMFTILMGAKDSLRIPGSFIVQTINAANPFQIAGRYCDITHEQSFTELSLRQAFLLAGFRRLEIGPVETLFPSTLKRRVKRLLRSAYHYAWRMAYALDGGDRFRVMTPLIRVVAYAE